MSRYHRHDHPDLPAGAFQHCGDRRIRLFGGGGGGGTYYQGLEKLYEQQAAQGAELQKIATEQVYPAYGELMQESKGAGSQANQEQAASRATADSSAATTNAMANVRDELTASGVDPTDPRYARTMANIQLSGAAQGAAAATGARDKVRDLGYAKLKDAVGMGMGVGSDAVSALSAAGGSLTSAGNMQMNQNLAQAQGQAAIASLGARILLKQGGLVRKCYAGGGTVKKQGGILGALGNIKPPAPPVSAPSAGASPASTLAQGIAGSGSSTAATRLGGKIEWLGEKAGSRGMQDFGRGMAGKPGLDAAGGDFSLSTATTPAAQAGGASEMGAVDYSLASTVPAPGAHGAAGLGSVAGEAAGVADTAGSGLLASTTGATGGAAVGAEAAGSGLAATGAAEGIAAAGVAEGGAAAAGAAGGLGAAGAAIGAAMPWVGGALLIGSALGLFRDGGKVYRGANNPAARNVITPHADDRRGGDVRGPGGPKDDKVPAMLSDGEFVMPAGAVKLYGPELERMRQEGLRYEQEAGIR